MSIEVHALAYASSSGIPAIHHATLYHYRIFNKNLTAITDTYVGLYVDSDLGNFDDDHFGSDSLRGLAYTYNGDNFDDSIDNDGDGILDLVGYGVAPPALGTFFIEGPLAPLDLKDNDRDGEIDEPGERHLTTTSAACDSSGRARCPITGRQYYNLLRGVWGDGVPMSVGGFGTDRRDSVTTFQFSGDPVTRSYWSELNPYHDGRVIESGDRRFFMASGPFNIEPGESADFTIAIVWARGKDHLDSITELRTAADQLKLAFENDFLDNQRIPVRDIQSRPGQIASLGHNFPEPFSDQTSISYRVSDNAHVRLSVYDSLGQEIEYLVDEKKQPGVYFETFSGWNRPSGVYFYRIQIGHASATRSMMLVK